jgi:tetratricopeptide (TPR) repeat protein
LYLYRKQYQKGREYLLAAKGLDPSDAQLLYNLSGIYIHFHEYEKALSTVAACLKLDPAFPGAQKTYDDLIKIIIAQK